MSTSFPIVRKVVTLLWQGRYPTPWFLIHTHFVLKYWYFSNRQGPIWAVMDSWISNQVTYLITKKAGVDWNVIYHSIACPEQSFPHPYRHRDRFWLVWISCQTLLRASDGSVFFLPADSTSISRARLWKKIQKAHTLEKEANNRALCRHESTPFLPLFDFLFCRKKHFKTGKLTLPFCTSLLRGNLANMFLFKIKISYF